MINFMLWHKAQAGISATEYEAALREFHRIFAEQKVPGWLGSHVSICETLPWVSAQGPVYQDCHFLQDSSALDRVNLAAISPNCREVHDKIAQHSCDEANGLYRYRCGSEQQHFTLQVWLTRPRDIQHEVFLDSLKSRISKSHSIWSRQMGLSHGPEFLIQGDADIDLTGLHYTQSHLQLITRYTT